MVAKAREEFSASGLIAGGGAAQEAIQFVVNRIHRGGDFQRGDAAARIGRGKPRKGGDEVLFGP
jgi:hypothetical protein